MVDRTSQAKTEFTGNVAECYDERRTKNKIWKAEYEITSDILKSYNEGSTILDVGIGTGRYISVYEQKLFKVIGIDYSNDMLKIARSKITSDEIKLIHGNVLSKAVYVFDLPTIDIIVCTRLISILNEEDSTHLLERFKSLNPKEVVISNREPIVGINDHKATLHRDKVCNSLWNSYEITQVLNTDFFVYRLYNGDK